MRRHLRRRHHLDASGHIRNIRPAPPAVSEEAPHGAVAEVRLRMLDSRMAHAADRVGLVTSIESTMPIGHAVSYANAGMTSLPNNFMDFLTSSGARRPNPCWVHTTSWPIRAC